VSRLSIGLIAHLRSVVPPSTSGRPLSEIIADDDDRAAFDAVRQAARGLARFHRSNLPMRRQYTTAEYLRSLERPVTILERERIGIVLRVPISRR